MKALEITVCGRVQGVGYRFFSIRAARRFQILGWTRNMPDGTVSIQAVGEDKEMDGFLDALRQGPSLSNVTDVKVKSLEDIPEFSGFEMRY